MSIIVADTSPLNLLIQLNQVHIVPALFGKGVIPPEVAAELGHGKAPLATQQFIAIPPDWLHIQVPTALVSFPNLDPGESAAIALAIEWQAPLLTI